MLPWRPDAKSIDNLSNMRRFMPYISPRRNDSVFHMFQDIQVDAAIEYLEKKNRGREHAERITLFHLFLRSTAQAMVLRPGVNRFVKGGRLWQRDGVFLTFSAKRAIEDGSPMITVKRRFARALYQEVGQTVSEPNQIEEEIHELLRDLER